MTKREEREHKFRLLFSTQFYKETEIPEQLKRYFESPDYEDGDGIVHMEKLSPEDEERLTAEVSEIVAKIPELDQKINAAIEGWKTDRMTKTDLTILRLSLYEILFMEDIPEKVSINEAIELAKKYGGNESGAFVNGVLARLVDEDRQTVAVKHEKAHKKVQGELTKKTEKDKTVHSLVNKAKTE